MTLVISPCGGFGNRIRTLCGGVILAKRLGLKLEHLWDGGEYKTAAHYSGHLHHLQYVHDVGFEHYFESTIPKYTDSPLTEYYNQWNLNDFWFIYQNYAYKKLMFTTLNILSPDTVISSRAVCIEASKIPMAFTNEEYTEAYKEYFIPRDNFLIQLPPLQDTTIGISVRNKYDFRFYFSDCILEECDLIPFLQQFDAPVVLFSDEKDYAKHLRTFLKHPVNIPFEQDDVKDKDFLEFLLLSKCSHVYGTKLSSFAEEAALFGGVPYTPIMPPEKLNPFKPVTKS